MPISVEPGVQAPLLASESSVPSGQTGEGMPADANAVGDVVQAGEQTANDQNLGPQDLPEELKETRKQLLRDYHDKTQKVAARGKQLESEWSQYKRDAETLYGIVDQPWFKSAIQEERTKRSGKMPDMELSDEQFSQVISDKGAFTKLVRQVAESIAERKVGEHLSPAQEELAQLKADRELDAITRRYSDFEKLNEDGVFDEHLKAGFDYETAYKLYKFDQAEADSPAKVEQEAQRLLQAKKDGSVGKAGVPKLTGAARVYKAKNLDEAFDQAWAAVQRGEHDARIERG